MQLGKRGIFENILHGYADADWGGDTRDRKSNTGYLFKYSGGLVSWRSKKQDCVSLSSTEAEVIALSEACQEAMWLKQLLKDFGEEVIEIKMFEDNQNFDYRWLGLKLSQWGVVRGRVAKAREVAATLLRPSGRLVAIRTASTSDRPQAQEFVFF
ncbi:hypothetical protein JTB14_026500 [Gonioctena quinquepunctata]|nr:hypothetical protein JTB14_026500 [Gonioctena quinquepunctata]